MEQGKKSLTCVVESQEQKGKNEAEAIAGERIAYDLPKLINDSKSHIQEAL